MTATNRSTARPLQSDATLYVVATPIGNLGDMVPRAVEVLQSVSLVAAEDTRHSRRLLDHFGIATRCVAYHDHSTPAELESLMARLSAGDDVALITDAGTPLLSDPGFRLVAAAQAGGVRVSPVPGACAAVAALSVAGLPTDRFAFEGFLPARPTGRQRLLEGLVGESRTLIFYEAPHRLLETLTDLERIFGGEREAVLARELTKLHETVRRLPLRSLRAWVAEDPNQVRGECVLVVQGAPARTGVDADAERVLRLLLEELPLKQASALAARITGQKKNELYELALRWRAAE